MVPAAIALAGERHRVGAQALGLGKENGSQRGERAKHIDIAGIRKGIFELERFSKLLIVRLASDAGKCAQDLYAPAIRPFIVAGRVDNGVVISIEPFQRIAVARFGAGT